MSDPKKKATVKPKVTFKDLKSKKNPKGGDESPKEEILSIKSKLGT
jgi:hypothetical protein